MTAGIYIIRSKTTQKVYVGASKKIEARWQQHVSLLRRGNHHSPKLQEDWSKYGEDDFEFMVIEEISNTLLSSQEQAYISQFNSFEDGYNSVGSVGVFEDAEPFQLWNLQNNPFYGRHITFLNAPNGQLVAVGADIVELLKGSRHNAARLIENNVFPKWWIDLPNPNSGKPIRCLFEPGVYQLCGNHIFKSEFACAFQDWYFEELLPSSFRPGTTLFEKRG